MHRVFLSTTYKLLNDVLFEITGVLQLLVVLPLIL
jgi:hypothetical protein